MRLTCRTRSRPPQLTTSLAGFGHIAISVDDVEAECKRLDGLGVQFKKRPEEGRMKHIAFVVRFLPPRRQISRANFLLFP